MENTSGFPGTAGHAQDDYDQGTQQKGFKCGICGAAFIMGKELRVHAKEHAHRYKCDECGKGYRVMSSLKIHMLTHNKESLELNKCKICGNTYELEHSLERHLRHDHNIKLCELNEAEGTESYTCNECGKRFTSEEKLLIHEDSHNTTDRPYACGICDRSFKNMSHLEEHHTEHTAEVFHCHQCGAELNCAQALHNHMRKHGAGISNPAKAKPVFLSRVCSSQADKSQMCDKCGKTFHDRKDLQIHHVRFCSLGSLTAAAAVQPNKVICQVCGKHISRQCLANHHALMHSAERPFVCDICGHSFKLRRHLRKHKAKHEHAAADAGGFPCDKCDKVLRTAETLKRHKRAVHSTEKVYHPCDVCGKQIKGLTALKTHVRLQHEGSKNIKCSHCDKCFRTNYNLKIHIERRHQPNALYQCKICKHSFGGKITAYDHFRYHPDVKASRHDYIIQVGETIDAPVGNAACADIAVPVENRAEHPGVNSGAATFSANAESSRVISGAATFSVNTDSPSVNSEATSLLTDTHSLNVNLKPAVLQNGAARPNVSTPVKQPSGVVCAESGMKTREEKDGDAVVKSVSGKIPFDREKIQVFRSNGVYSCDVCGPDSVGTCWRCRWCSIGRGVFSTFS